MDVGAMDCGKTGFEAKKESQATNIQNLWCTTTTFICSVHPSFAAYVQIYSKPQSYHNFKALSQALHICKLIFLKN